MWPVFFLSFVLAGAFLYVPGFFFFKGLGFGTAPSLCLSPAASLLIYCLLGVAYERLGVWASWCTMVPVTLALCLMFGIVAAFVRHLLLGNGVGAGVRGTEGADESRGEGVAYLTILALVPFFLMALAVGMYVFVLPLDGPDSFAQNWDNAFHLNAIAQFLRTGNYSAFSMGAWQPGEVAPVADVIGYYPASWSILVALVDSVTSTSLPCAVNAANFALLSLVFPSSMCFLTYVLFGGSRTFCRAAAVVTPLFVAFPWMFVEYGSLNPNLAGMSLSPLVVGSFILLGRRLLGGSPWLAGALCFVVTLVSGAAAHPSAVFSSAVVLAPFCVWLSVQVAKKAWSGSPKLSLRLHLVAISVSCVLVALWVGFACLPPLHNVVTNAWNYCVGPSQAVTNLITLSFVRDYGQPLLSLLVFVGIVTLIRENRATWIVASCALASFIFLVDLVLSSDFGKYNLKAIAAGFWYQDPYRTAATVVLAVIPLASAGLARVMVFVQRRAGIAQVDWRGSTRALSFSRRYAPTLVTGLVVLAILWPSFRLPGVTDVTTGFGGFRGDMARSFDVSSNVLDDEEKCFLERVKNVVPGDALIVNMPDDGSVFANGLFGLNTYYRVFGVQWKTDETTESKVVRERASHLADDPEVRSAFSSIGAKYLLILDSTDEESDTRQFLVSFQPELWQGIADVHEDTPGLSLMLSEGDMRLYRVLD